MEAANFVMYLCTAEKSACGRVSGFGGSASSDLNNDDVLTIEDIYKEDISLTYIYDLDGEFVASNVTVDLDGVSPQIVQSNAVEGDPDDEDCEGGTGNEGATTTHWFRDAGLLIMPQECAAGFLLGEAAKSGEVCRILELATKKLRNDAKSDPSVDNLAQLCRDMVLKYRDEVSITVLMKLGLKLWRLSLVEEAIRTIDETEEVPLEVLEAICGATDTFGFEKLAGRQF
ncbi:hypothetical protein LTR36_006205 [Oleoguttula mirabilis]|uniref:Uncharacterized protein n=1 Tax=Oleoguttula mirabilis TaxID=1507867 RepID=A0AAV9JDB7_9PEZI|nr:hypothetical protein LTR36_006205 [Oleoguttula mirabilis]